MRRLALLALLASVILPAILGTVAARAAGNADELRSIAIMSCWFGVIGAAGSLALFKRSKPEPQSSKEG